MKSIWPRFRSYVAGGLAAAVVVLLGCEAICQSKSATTDGIAVTTTVTVEIKGGKIQLYPRVSFIRPKGVLTFTVTGLEAGQTLELDFKVTEIEVEAVDAPLGTTRKGPFARVKGQPRGRITLTKEASSEILTYDVVHKDAIVWKYEIALRDREGNDLDVVDPATVGKGEGG
jgi:hypothetical protein